MRYQGRLCVPNVDGLINRILEEALGCRFFIYPGFDIYVTCLREVFWSERLEKYIAEFVSKYQNCQLLKVEHQKSGGLLQEIQVPTWNWEDTTMDFVVGLPRSQSQNDSLWVIVDRLTKSAYFIPIKSTYSAEDYASIHR